MIVDQVAGVLPEVWEMHFFDPPELTVVQLSQLAPGLIRCGLGMRGPMARGRLH